MRIPGFWGGPRAPTQIHCRQDVYDFFLYNYQPIGQIDSVKTIALGRVEVRIHERLESLKEELNSIGKNQSTTNVDQIKFLEESIKNEDRIVDNIFDIQELERIYHSSGTFLLEASASKIASIEDRLTDLIRPRSRLCRAWNISRNIAIGVVSNAIFAIMLVLLPIIILLFKGVPAEQALRDTLQQMIALLQSLSRKL